MTQCVVTDKPLLTDTGAFLKGGAVMEILLYVGKTAQ